MQVPPDLQHNPVGLAGPQDQNPRKYAWNAHCKHIQDLIELDNVLAIMKQTQNTTTALLAWNEPDLRGQASMSPAHAAQFWYQLEQVRSWTTGTAQSAAWLVAAHAQLAGHTCAAHFVV